MKITKTSCAILLAAIIFACSFSNVITANAAGTIYCSNCGKQIDSSSKYCMYCGHEVVVVQQATGNQKTVTQKSSNTVQYNSAYIIGSTENTFAGLYKRMCVNLDLKTNPVPTPDQEEGKYGNGHYEYVKVLKDDSETYEYIGYVRYADGTNRYMVRCWRGYHKDGAIIEMDVYYTLDGKYIGNIQRDLSAGTSTSSHNSPYYIPGEPMNHE